MAAMMFVHAGKRTILLFLLVPHEIRMSVSSALFPAVHHCAVAIAKVNSRRLSLLCEEFGIIGLAAKLSDSQALLASGGGAECGSAP
jgi:hypothetical protein